MSSEEYIQLPRCNQDIYANGHMVMMTHTIASQEIEKWVQKVAVLSGQPVDWHYAGGRACILALGDLARVREAILTLLPEHDALQKAASEEILPGHPFEPNSTHYAPNEINTAHEYGRQMTLKRNDK